MKLQVLKELKAIVKQTNASMGNDELELWFPGMYRDGEWSCSIVGGSTMSSFVFERIFEVIQRESLLYFIGAMNGDVSIHIQ